MISVSIATVLFTQVASSKIVWVNEIVFLAMIQTGKPLAF